MKQRRLQWLFAVMVLLLAWRVFDWPHAAPSSTTSVVAIGPIEPVRPVIVAGAADPTVTRHELTADLPTFREELTEPAGNAFAVRQAPGAAVSPSVASPATPPPSKSQAFVGPPRPPPPAPPSPPPPPPSLQVIGTWNDARGASVFVAGFGHTTQGRLGEILFGQYRLTAISAGRIVIHELSSNRDFQYPVPTVDSRTPSTPLL